MKENVLRSYEYLSTHYAFDVDSKPYNAYLERPAMINLLPCLQGKKVLDAGCAAGWYARYMADHGAAVTAFDLSPSMIDVTKRRAGNANVHASVHDLTDPLPADNDSFDIIVSSLTLHYIKEWRPVFQEFHRTLKPGGTFLFSTHHPFMDYMNHKAENYYATQQIEDEWTVNGERVPMTFYRRPLEEIISSVTDHFRFINLTEPRPTQKFKEVHPEGFDKVSRKPNFMIVKAEKPESP
ncbi:class I SAM-dependent methyltransferase [Halobacillus sp. Nhm2S1]|uniref:class I SAM-dependent methyltransferase n=1 Tax=Halobacillus sp. Nhm2S1 TaxID=2866716 RepID=UPI001C732F9D|nr:class I SAM-dependent methyltransferase [Halobacillus sp. Nhm2S1]MBX0357265.1 class I SAM-dependent methyltransferase [Halobacillus sp. Nhm2S1]